MIHLQLFKGMIPRFHPALLPDGYAQKCRNARMRNGALVPYRSPTLVTALSDGPFTHARKFGSTWLGFKKSVSIVPGPVAGDRAYIAGDGVPRVQTFGDNAFSFPLSLPSPVSDASVTVVTGAPGDEAERIVFAYTWVTSLGEESPPSPLSDEVMFSPGMVVEVGSFSATPSERGITHRRIYRSVQDFDGSTGLYFVKEVAVDVSSYNYSANDPVGEPIPTVDFDSPPDGLAGLTTMPNGIIAGFSGRDLYFCEPWKPHAWPQKYMLTVDYDIVGMAAFGSALAIMTKGTPYIVQGTHPESMVMERMDENRPCVSARGIVDLGYAAAYPSPDGLVIISTQGAQLITRNLFTREEWTKLKPSTFVAAQYEGRYVFLHGTDDGDLADMGLIDLTGDTPFHMDCSAAGLDLFFEIETGNLYLLDADGVSVKQFDGTGGPLMTATWRSKRIHTPAAMSIGWGFVRADSLGAPSDTCKTRIHVGGGADPYHTMTSVNAPERLPAGRLDDTFEVEIETNMQVYSFGASSNVLQLTG